MQGLYSQLQDLMVDRQDEEEKKKAGKKTRTKQLVSNFFLIFIIVTGYRYYHKTPTRSEVEQLPRYHRR